MPLPADSDARSESLVRNIEARRKALGLSSQELARKAGLAEHYVRDLESRGAGRTGPGVFQLLPIAQALGCTIDDLLGGPPRDFEGLAIIDEERVAIFEKAKRLSDLDPLRWPAKHLLGIYLDRGCKIAPASELSEVLNRFRETKERLEAEDDGARREGGKKR